MLFRVVGGSRLVNQKVASRPLASYLYYESVQVVFGRPAVRPERSLSRYVGKSGVGGVRSQNGGDRRNFAR